MKTKIAVWGVSLMMLLAAMPLIAADCSTPAQPTNDAAAVKATVTNYIEAYYSSDPVRMECSLHPQYLKHTISGPAGATRMTEHSGLEMIEDIQSQQGKITPIADRVEKIIVLDVSGDVATAKLETARWVDYLSLAKLNGQWKILSVVLREQD